MKIRHQMTVFAFVTVAMLLSGCGDSPTEHAAPSGSLSFNYSGVVSGTYTVSGAPRRRADFQLEFGSFAMGAREPGNWLHINAFRAGDNPHGDLIVIQIQGIVGPKSVTYNRDYCFSRCTSIHLDLRTTLVFGDQDPDLVCTLRSASIEVTTFDSERARGTFSGQGDCLNRRTYRTHEPFYMTNGTFDVPILAGFGSL